MASMAGTDVITYARAKDRAWARSCSMSSSITHIPAIRAEWTHFEACIGGSTGRSRGALRRRSGGPR